MFLKVNEFFLYPFLQVGLVGVIGLALICSLLSPLVIARRQAFMGAALSHATLVGLALGFSFFEASSNLGVFGVTLIVTLILSLILAESTYRNPLPRDSLIGIFFTTCMGLGMIIHQMGPAKNIDLMSYLFGNLYLLNNSDLAILAMALLVVALGILLPLKKWLYLSFSEEAAYQSGINVRLSHYLFMALLTLAIVAGLKLAGTVLINTFIIVPGMVALRVAKSNRSVFFLSALFALFSAVISIVLSNAFNLSLGPVLCLVQFLAMLMILAGARLRTAS